MASHLLDGRNRKGDRDRIHFHFLRGILHCAECDDAGRISRLVYSQNRGNGGTYEYYVCTAKQRGLCTMRTVRVNAVEAAVADVVEAERFTTEEITVIRTEVRRAFKDMQAADEEQKDALRKQVRTLEEQEERLIDLAASGTINSAKLRDRLEAVTLQKGAISEKLSRTVERLQHGVDKIEAYIDLLEYPNDLYQDISDLGRRALLHALFNRLIVRVIDEDLQLTSERTEINATLHDWRNHHRSHAESPTRDSGDQTAEENERASRISTEDSLVSTHRLTQSKGLNKPVLVEGK